MNILYLSKLSGNPWAGPTYCVPQQIEAQSKIDNVLWLNLNHVYKKEWNKDSYIFHNIDSVNPSLSQLPIPFDRPDLVVIHQMYAYPFCSIIHEIQSKKIPYIIRPHGEFSQMAQKQKKIKKFLGNLIYFNKMVDKSISIEYLTEKEFNNSAWQNKKHIVVPNGISLNNVSEKQIPVNGIRASFIGRLDIYVKGLDVLLNAVFLSKDKLKEAKFKLDIYGNDENSAIKNIQKFIDKNGIKDIVSVHGGVYGEEKKRILENTDMFVLTSRTEGLPMSVLEALSYGIPCFVTPETNLGKEIALQDAGWCTSLNSSQMAEDLFNAVQQIKNWRIKSLNAYKMAGLYSWDAIAQKAHIEYEKILNSLQRI